MLPDSNRVFACQDSLIAVPVHGEDTTAIVVEVQVFRVRHTLAPYPSAGLLQSFFLPPPAAGRKERARITCLPGRAPSLGERYPRAPPGGQLPPDTCPPDRIPPLVHDLATAWVPQPSRWALTRIWTLLRSALETGQPCSACWATFSKPASSNPGTLPLTLSSMVEILKPPSTCSNVQVALTASRSAGVPDWARAWEKAMA